MGIAVALMGGVVVACASPVAPSGTLSPSSSAATSSTPSPVASAHPDELFELYLLAGIRLDASIDCAPVRDGRAPAAIAAVECAPKSGAVDRFRVTLFPTTEDVLAYYLAEMAAHGVILNTGSCSEVAGESTYYPGPDNASVPYRHGCFVAGVAHYRAIVDSETVDGAAHVYVAIAGTAPNVSSQLQEYAWLGNEDVPGSPTLWAPPD